MTMVGDPAEWTYAVGQQWSQPITRAQVYQAVRMGQLHPYGSVWNVRTQQTYSVAAVLGTPSYGSQPPKQQSEDALMRAMLPVGQSGWAIVAGYLGLVGWVIFPLAPFALGAAELGRRDIRANPNHHGMYRVVVGFVGGTIGMLVLIFLVVSALLT